MGICFDCSRVPLQLKEQATVHGISGRGRRKRTQCDDAASAYLGDETTAAAAASSRVSRGFFWLLSLLDQIWPGPAPHFTDGPLLLTSKGTTADRDLNANFNLENGVPSCLSPCHSSATGSGNPGRCSRRGMLCCF